MHTKRNVYSLRKREREGRLMHHASIDGVSVVALLLREPALKQIHQCYSGLMNLFQAEPPRRYNSQSAHTSILK